MRKLMIMGALLWASLSFSQTFNFTCDGADLLLDDVASLGTNIISWSGTQYDWAGPNPDREYSYTFTSSFYKDITIKLLPLWSSGLGIKYEIYENSVKVAQSYYSGGTYINRLDSAIQKVFELHPLTVEISGHISVRSAFRNGGVNQYTTGGTGDLIANTKGLQPGEVITGYQWHYDYVGNGNILDYQFGTNRQITLASIEGGSTIYVTTKTNYRSLMSEGLYHAHPVLSAYIRPDNSNKPGDGKFNIVVNGLRNDENIAEVHWGINFDYQGETGTALAVNFDPANDPRFWDSNDDLIPGVVVDASIETTQGRKFYLHTEDDGNFTIPGEVLNIAADVFSNGSFRIKVNGLVPGETITRVTAFAPNGGSHTYNNPAGDMFPLSGTYHPAFTGVTVVTNKRDITWYK